MSDNNPLARARQALQLTGKGATPAALDQTKGNALLAQARAAAAGQTDVRATPPPPVAIGAPRVEKVRLQMNCGMTGRPFIAIAERRGDELMLVGNEVPQRGHGTGSAPAERLSGSYRIDIANDWACPHCRASDDTWSCNCTQVPGAFHCGGRRGRLRFCACGKLEDRNLVEVETVEVRGQSMAATSRSGPSRHGSQNLPALLPKR
jgi:hypothetical protein